MGGLDLQLMHVEHESWVSSANTSVRGANGRVHHDRLSLGMGPVSHPDTHVQEPVALAPECVCILVRSFAAPWVGQHGADGTAISPS
jgi:hypothetical protein